MMANLETSKWNPRTFSMGSSGGFLRGILRKTILGMPAEIRELFLEEMLMNSIIGIHKGTV